MDGHTLPPCPHLAGAGDIPGQGGVPTSLTGGSSGSVPPFSKNLEKVSTSRVLLNSIIWNHGSRVH